MTPPKPSLDRFIDARIACYGLVVGCPSENEKATCPLKEVRNLEVQDRIDWVEKQTDEKCMNIYQEHCHCLPEVDDFTNL